MGNGDRLDAARRAVVWLMRVQLVSTVGLFFDLLFIAAAVWRDVPDIAWKIGWVVFCLFLVTYLYGAFAEEFYRRRIGPIR